MLGAGQARAVVVNVNGQNWNVTTFTGTYNDNISKFATPANGGVMPWFTGCILPYIQCSNLAESFANVVGQSLGLPNTEGSEGPFFAQNYFPRTSPSTAEVYFWHQFENLGLGSQYQPASSVYTWAQADLATVPGPLPAFGAAAAFGYSRTLRKRIKATNAVGASATAG